MNNYIPDEEMNFSESDIKAEVNKNHQDNEDFNYTNQIDDSQSNNISISEIQETSTNFQENTESIETSDKTEQSGEAEKIKEVENKSYDSNVYAAAIELAKENGLLNIPDDIGEIDDNKWQELLDENERERELRALNNIRMNAGDPQIVELLDYVLQGGTWHGFNDMQNNIQDELDINSLDHTAEEDQRYLLELYLSEGLDENNPAHVRRLQNVKNDIDNIFERLEQDQIAKEAKDFLLSKTQAEKEQIKQQQQQYVEEQNRKREQEHTARQKWNNEFKSILNNRTWSQNKKEKVISQFDIVQLDNGNEMELWQYKLNNIWRSPELTQVLMDFLADFDPNTLQFNNSRHSVKKQVTNTIQELLNNKQQNKNNSHYTSNKRIANNVIPKIDPLTY